MPNRREVLSHIIAAGGLLGSAEGIARSKESIGAVERLRILILGGTGHLGSFLVRAAVARGHHVAVFSRGRKRVSLPASVERLIGNRNGDLESISHRDWDEVTDVATYGPGWVRSLGEALRGRVGHYTFISTLAVYANPAANKTTRETSKLLVYHGKADPYAPVYGEGPNYGALKVLCEREAERQFPDRALILRPGYIVLPGDPNGSIAYWPVRAAKGGEMMAAGAPTAAIQYIDIRDMADWWIRLIERRVTGIFNTVGPVTPSDVRQLVDTARHLVPRETRVTWVPIRWLASRTDARMWGQIFFWALQGLGGLTRINIDQAIAAGLTTRPLGRTLAAALRWYEQEPAAERAILITGHHQQKDGRWVAVRVPWSDYLQHERAALARWHSRHSRSHGAGG